MVIYDKYDVVFQEIPNEVSLVFTLKGCSNNCEGCHSPHLRETFGNELNEESFSEILNKYQDEITCVLFMGDSYKNDVIRLLKLSQLNGLKTALYSGLNSIDSKLVEHLDYYKIGSYSIKHGGLNKFTTNQKLYKIEDDKLIDITNLFWK